MNKLSLVTILISITSVCFGQNLSESITGEHILINGTNIYMVPPESFRLSQNFKGFQKPDDPTAMIMIMEIPGPFSEVSGGFNAEMLKTRGLELKRRKTLKISNYDGLMIELDQSANGMEFSKHILIYGNDASTTMINGVFLKDSLVLGNQIKESMLSTIVKPDLDVDPRAGLSYTIDETAGGLKFKAVIGNGMLFNRDLKIPTQSKDKATLLTDKSFAKIEIDNKKVFCISRLKKYPDDFSVNINKGINEVEIDNLKGYELYATNNDDETKEMYQLILFDDDGGYYILAGTYLKGEDGAVNDIRNIIKTFKRK